jgi:hypothetical protein
MGTYDTFSPMFARIEPQLLPREPLGARLHNAQDASKKGHLPSARAKEDTRLRTSRIEQGTPSRGSALSWHPEEAWDCVNPDASKKGHLPSARAKEDTRLRGSKSLSIDVPG